MQVIRRKIPIRIKNVENPKGGGTVIHPDPDLDLDAVPDFLSGPSGSSTPSSPSLPGALSPLLTQNGAFTGSGGGGASRKLPTAVTIKERMVVLNVNSNRKSVSHGFLARIFGALDRFGVVVDLISTSEVHVSMAIGDSLPPKVLDRLVKDLKQNGTVSLFPRFSRRLYPDLAYRCLFTATWLSSRWSGIRCATWSVSPGSCLRHSPRGT